MTGDRRAQSFEAALGRAARELVVEPLPVDVLGVPLPAGARTAPTSRLPRAILLAAVLAAVVLASVAAGVLGPAAPPRPPVLQPTTALTSALRSAGWTCSSNRSPSVAPARSSAVARPDAATCLLPATSHPLVAAVVVDEDAAGVTSGITIKADILGASSGALETRRADTLYLAIGLPFSGAADAAAVRSWLRAQGSVQPGASVTTVIAGVPVKLGPLPGGGDLVEIGTVATPH